MRQLKEGESALRQNKPNFLAAKTSRKAMTRKVASQGCLPIGHLLPSLMVVRWLLAAGELCEHSRRKAIREILVRLASDNLHDSTEHFNRTLRLA